MGEGFFQIAGQHRADDLLGRILPGVDEADAQCLGVQEHVVFDVGGDECVASLVKCVPERAAAGTAPHRHAAHRAARIRIAHAIGPQGALDALGKVRQGHGVVGDPDAPKAVNPLLSRYPSLVGGIFYVQNF